MNDSATYPPPQHLLRDLQPQAQLDRGRLVALEVPIVPALLACDGTVRLGGMGLAADIFAGRIAVGESQPDWAVTSDLSIHRGLVPRGGERLRVEATTLRAGKTTLVFDLQLTLDGGKRPAAHCTTTFTRIPRRAATQAFDPEEALPFADPGPDAGFDGTILDALGVRVLDAAAGQVEASLSSYCKNSVGAFQGGAILLTADAAIEALASHELDCAVVTTDLTAHYIGMGKVGPVRTRARVLRRDAEELVARIEFFDAGQDDRFMTSVTARAERA